jgi:hypothetical protein
VNVTEVPTQIFTPGLAEINTDGTAVGFMVTSILNGAPVHDPDVGVTTYRTVTAADVELVSVPVVNDG